MLTAVFGLLILSALVIFHEFGHLWVARRLGVRVERFSVGFGPVLFSRKIRGIQFALSAFPLGGYVKMGGDDPRDRASLKPGDLFAATWWRRILIALGGPGANFVLAIILSISLLWIGIRIPDAPNTVGTVAAGSTAEQLGFRSGDRIVAVNGDPVTSLQYVLQPFELDGDATNLDTVHSLTLEGVAGSRTVKLTRDDMLQALPDMNFPVPAVVGEVVIGTPAYKSGMVVGDKILSVDGTTVENFSELQAIIVKNPGNKITLGVLRDGKEVEIPVTPFGDTSGGGDAVGKIGVAAASPGTYLLRMGFTDGILKGTQSAVATVGVMVRGMGMLFSDVSNLSQIAGPVAIIQASGDAAKAGLDRLLDRAILFSIALMVFNLLPIPILDGGMVMLTLVEVILRRPVGDRGLALYQGIGIAVMGSLLIFVLINDPLRILQRQSALGRIGEITP